MKIALITDGNNQLGMGHVYQTMVLSMHLRARLHDTVSIRFMTQSGDAVVDLLRSTGHQVDRHGDLDGMFDALVQGDHDRVIIDKLDVDPVFAQRLATRENAKLAILTNLTDANRHAHLTVMAGMGSGFKNLRIEAPNGQVQLWGPRYWLIRPEFFQWPSKKPSVIKRTMLMFGGADPANLTSSALHEILTMHAGINVTVVLGAAFAHRAELDAVLQRHAATASCVHVVSNLVNVAQVMHENDLVLVSPGLSFFEALLAGTPVLCFHQNEFQRNAWAGHIHTHDQSEVGKISQLIETQAFIRPQDPAIVAMQMGQGVDDIISEILS